MPAPGTWLYDFGNITATGLGTAISGLDTLVNGGRSAAITLINSGAYGSTSATYRVVLRSDGLAPAGYVVEIRFVS